jgi:hypothetical protein
VVVVVGGVVVGVVVGGEVGGVVGGTWVMGVCDAGGEVVRVGACVLGVTVLGVCVAGVGVAGVGVTTGVPAVTGTPLFRTANHAFATPCPLAWPFFLSPVNRYRATWWNANWKLLPTLMSENPFTPLGPAMCAPFEASTGGQILAQAPVQVAVPDGSLAKR